MKQHNRSIVTRCMAAAVMAGVLTVREAAAVTGTLVLTDNTEIRGDISWFASSREYNVSSASVSRKVPLRQVNHVIVAKPAQFDAAVQDVQGHRYAAAVAPLEAIVKSYEMMDWDVMAARFLAEAYLSLNQAGKAVEMSERIIRVNPGAATSGDLARIYWSALQKDGKEAKLSQVLGEAVKAGSREVAAVAQLWRADLVRAGGDHRKALLEGYLRTVILFRDVREVQAEALFKAAESFQQLGQQSHAEKMRQQLLQAYPSSPEAQKVRGGA
jgi:TolA-binding protein